MSIFGSRRGKKSLSGLLFCLFIFLHSVLLAAVLCDKMLCKQDTIAKFSKFIDHFLFILSFYFLQIGKK